MLVYDLVACCFLFCKDTYFNGKFQVFSVLLLRGRVVSHRYAVFIFII